MNIIVTMLSGESRPLPVSEDTTVGSLKKLISQHLGMPPEEQRLSYDNGQKTNLTDESRSLISYGLGPGSKVWVLRTEPTLIQVFLKNDKGQMHTYNITAAETVDEFKRKVQNREGVPVDQQRLINEGKQMDHGKLADYGVRRGSTIYLALRVRGGHLHLFGI